MIIPRSPSIMNLMRSKTRRDRFPKFSHQWLDQANLEMCCAIAKKIRNNPALMQIPRRNLAVWKKKVRPWPPAFREWELILQKHSSEKVLQILTQDSAYGQR